MTTLSRITLPMPRLGETMEEGVIAEWLVAPGQSFKRGDPLLEVETDKTMVEYPALGDGTLAETLVTAGDVVEVGTPIAIIESTDKWEGIESEETGALDSAETIRPETTAPEPAHPLAQSDRLRATPLARRIAEQNQVALDGIAGTGRRGRIEADDVRAALSEGGIPASPVPVRGVAGTALLIHGFAGLGANWAALRAALQRTGLSTYAPDLPGHGRNSAEADTVETLVDWLVTELSGQTAPVHLVGHSLGAHIAAQAASRLPEKVHRLVLLAPAGCGPEIRGSFVTGMAASPNAGELAHLMRLLGPKAAGFDTETLQAMERELTSGRLQKLATEVVRGDTQRIDTIRPLRALGEKVTTTAIFGLTDQIIPRDHVFHMPAHVACHMVDAGHMPHWDATDAVARIIMA